MTETLNITEAEAIELGGKLWVVPPGLTEAKRYYINNWADFIDLEVSYYGTGNVSGAELRGERISNAAARRILAGKVWIEDGSIYTRNLSDEHAATVNMHLRNAVVAIRAAAEPSVAELRDARVATLLAVLDNDRVAPSDADADTLTWLTVNGFTYPSTVGNHVVLGKRGERTAEALRDLGF